LERCGLRGLRKDELELLGAISERYCSGTKGNEVPFDIFMRLMQELFACGIAGLRWQGIAEATTLAELEGRPGFAVAMLRERMKVVSHVGVPYNVLEGGRELHSSQDFSTDGHASRMMPTSSVPKAKHKSVSLNCSRTGSRKGLRRLSRSGQVRFSGSHHNSTDRGPTAIDDSISAADLEPPVQGSGGRVMNLKGLPPSEAMLSRKQFRPCSVDLANYPKQADTQQQAITVLPSAVPLAKRKVKPAQDSLLLVTDAIAKLSEVEIDPDSDEDGG